MMASSRTFRFLAFACLILGINATINPDETFVLLCCQEGDQAIHIAPLDTLQFTNIPVSSNGYVRSGVSYDPVDQKVYYSLFNTPPAPITASGIHSVDLDGSNEKKVISKNGIFEVLVDPDARRLYYIVLGAMYWSNLDGTGETMIANPSSSAAQKLAKIGSRILVSGPGKESSDVGILSLDNNGTLLTDEIYEVGPNTGADIDLAAGRLYWIALGQYSVILTRQDITDYSSTCRQTVLDSVDLHGGSMSIPANMYDVKDMALHQDYAYVVGSGTDASSADFSGLLRINKRTGVLEDVGDKSQHGGKCVGLHIHDPAKIEAAIGFEGGLDTQGVNYTVTPVNTSIPVDVVEQWFGGMEANLVIPITGPIADWHLEISFPRQVFKLEIQGCIAEISEEKTIRYGRRKGTDFVISPSPASRSPLPGQDLQITVIAQTWKDVRVMKRGISARFVPVLEPLVCDPGM